MTGYMDDIKKYYQNIIDDYNLKFVKITESTAGLVGKDFAITITTSIDGALLTYICQNKEGDYKEYWFDNYISQSIIDEDREGVASSKTIHENALAELQIMANVLKNHWSNILLGDKTWIQDYLNDEWGEEPENANEKEIQVLRPYFEAKS